MSGSVLTYILGKRKIPNNPNRTVSFFVIRYYFKYSYLCMFKSLINFNGINFFDVAFYIFWTNHSFNADLIVIPVNKLRHFTFLNLNIESHLGLGQLEISPVQK